ncbi:hypothetical protein E1B28_012683 [Marasmius oreades]|uniref:Uncharacterized protein n=1 Tax=Marasmius oreades TaxID=181124 RepID=A0A9P7UP75_9AGAR|nr:uncharacterized protein E1B28_012683 [Marasmius oreades]KAG7088715.1 hypothetical protein E1B28_012683 [Marasmius oreades]
MEGFNERLVMGVSQDDPILDVLAKTLLDTPKLFGRIQSNLIITATMDFITSLMMDMKIHKMAVNLGLTPFATYGRNMSGISTSYAMFVFPTEVDVEAYIQYLPQIRVFIDCMDEVLSFYKEETAGEENFASMLAMESSITKYEAIQRLADDVAGADKGVLRGLAGDQLALDNW